MRLHTHAGMKFKTCHDAIVKWKHFPPYWSFVQGIHRSPVNPPLHPHKVTRSFDVFFDLRLNNGWVNNRDVCDLRRHRAHYDVIAMC